MSMSIHTLRVIALATFASGAILAGSVSALAQTGASPSGLPQASPATAGHAAAAGQPIGLPRVRDYQPVPELRDVHFSFGTALIAPDDVKILEANAAWLRANPGHLVLIEGHCDNRGATGKKNEFNMDLGEHAGYSPEPHHHLELRGRAAAMCRGQRAVLESEPAVALSCEAALVAGKGHARGRPRRSRRLGIDLRAPPCTGRSLL